MCCWGICSTECKTDKLGSDVPPYRAKLIFVSVLSLAAQDAAAQIIPSGQCTVIVASRINMAEVGDFMSANSQLSYDAVYEAENGWLAVSIGLLPTEGAAEVLAELKARNAIPQDSYCSTGRRYLTTVWYQPVSPSEPTSPPESREPDQSNGAGAKSSGTGFFVDANGHVMTRVRTH